MASQTNQWGTTDPTALNVQRAIDPLGITGSSYTLADPNVVGGAVNYGQAPTSGMQAASGALQGWLSTQQAPTAQAAAGYGGAQIDTSGQQQWADIQRALAGQYQAIASGAAPSAAEMMLKQAQDRNTASIMGAAAAQRGSNFGASQREMLGALGDANLQAQQQMAAVRAQEQERAMAGLSGLAGQARGMEQQGAIAQAGLTQQAGMQGAEFGQQAAMLNPQLQAQFQNLYMQGLQSGLSAEEAMMNAQVQMSGIQQQADTARMQALAGIETANAAAANEGGGFLGGIL